MARRTLALRKETLAELDTADLAQVAGASSPCVTYTKVPTGCMCTGMWPSLNIPCRTTTVIESLPC